MAMSKTEALRAASKAHGNPWRAGASGWKFAAPNLVSELSGPCVEVAAGDYFAARTKRARRVASCALELMGYAQEDAESLTYDQRGSARDIVEQAITRQPRSAS